ncbi:redox-regulated ATPase YchF [Chloroflexota bacterium]
MEIGIIGLPKSGKTTLFNSLTKGKAETAAYSTAALEPNIGVTKVPDQRLRELEAKFKPKRTIPAEVKYIDVAGAAKGWGRGEGLGGELLVYLSKVDALIHVVRIFEDEGIPHIEGSVDPRRDLATVDLELSFSDLGIVEKRLKRIEDSLKGAKSPERETILREQALLERIRGSLEKEVPLQEQGLSLEESKVIENYQFLTAKPMLVVLNIGEPQLAQAASLEAEIGALYPRLRVAALCGKLEMELAELSEAEAEEFRTTLDMGESGLDRLIRLSYQLLGMISFFTTASGEVKAWTITRGTTAVKAAGKIHSDMERGFIRAEVISYDDLVKCGGLAEGRKQGLLRLEGKGYPIQDGDVITFLFNV